MSGRSMSVPKVRGLRLVWVMIILSVAGGCSDPYAEVRERMSEAERLRFDRGARAAAPCATCHDLAGSASKIGPPLRGLAGRRAGSLPGFAYSPALSGSGVVWDARSLDAFLASPQSFAPGNRMMSPGVPDAGQRSDLVFFLLRAGPPERAESD